MVTYMEQYVAPLHTAVADGLPHKVFTGTLAAETPRPLKLAVIASDLITIATKEIMSTNTVYGCIYVMEIPSDYPGRTSWDKSTVYTSGDTKVPILRCEIGRDYHLVTATDFTSVEEGAILIPGAAGDVQQPDDPTPDAATLCEHCFILLHAISTTEIVMRYMGYFVHDTA